LTYEAERCFGSVFGFLEKITNDLKSIREKFPSLSQKYPDLFNLSTQRAVHLSFREIDQFLDNDKVK